MHIQIWCIAFIKAMHFHALNLFVSLIYKKSHDLMTFILWINLLMKPYDSKSVFCIHLCTWFSCISFQQLQFHKSNDLMIKMHFWLHFSFKWWEYSSCEKSGFLGFGSTEFSSHVVVLHTQRMRNMPLQTDMTVMDAQAITPQMRPDL